MSSCAIFIPTYRNHFHLNIVFLKSVISKNDGIECLPSIFFGTSTREEKDELVNIITTECPESLLKVSVFDLEPSFYMFNDYLSGDNYDPDLTSFYQDGRYSLINLKKLTGVNEVFKKGYDSVVILDSETIQVKHYSLSKAIEGLSLNSKFRFSFHAHQHPLITKIQHDSIRTVVSSYDTSHPFSKSYGWFDNLCIYRKDIFNSFIEYMAKEFDKGNDYEKIMFVTTKFKGLSFEWLVYKAYQFFVLNDFISYEDIDEIIIKQTGMQAWSTPQTENIYQYLTGDEKKDSVIAPV